MRKMPSMLAIIIIIFFITSFSLSIKFALAQTDSHSITRVNHTVEILYNGYILINDTIELAGAPNSFLIGFPYKYGSYILKCAAYNSSNIFPVKLNVPLENRIGFYGIQVDFSQGSPQVFTVAFVLSNDLLTVSQSKYTLDFPAYPAFTESVEENCSVEIVLPMGASDVMVVKDDGVVNASTYSGVLSAFAYSPANVTFSYTGDKLRLFDVKELKREIGISGLGEIEGVDRYYISSKSSDNINYVEVVLPPNATNPIANDEFGRKMADVEVVDREKNSYKITFSLSLESYRSTRFSVKYSLPTQVYISTQEGANSFNVSSLLLKDVNYYIEAASVSFTLPEGARILKPEDVLIGSSSYISRSVFQETITIDKQGITYLEGVLPLQNVLQIAYEFNPLWLSFRPTLVIWALAVFGLAVAVVWKRPKAAEVPVAAPLPAAAVRLRPEYIKSFINAYEEKRKITLELESLETRVRKGKIPRRRYKVQRKTLETRLNSLAKSLAEYKERMRAAGGLYADLMRQLEVAETEINEVEASSRSIEARHSRGELSLEAYRRLLSDYQRRKEKAETTINGILLRLREETTR